MSPLKTVTIPQVEIEFEQLLSVIRHLKPAARSEVAKALVETELEARMEELIESLAKRPPAEDVTDADIMREVNVVREISRS